MEKKHWRKKRKIIMVNITFQDITLLKYYAQAMRGRLMLKGSHLKFSQHSSLNVYISQLIKIKSKCTPGGP
jgi:hypothetical protein